MAHPCGFCKGGSFFFSRRAPIVRITIKYNYSLDFIPVSCMLAVFFCILGGGEAGSPLSAQLASQVPSFRCLITSLFQYFVPALPHLSTHTRNPTRRHQRSLRRVKAMRNQKIMASSEPTPSTCSAGRSPRSPVYPESRRAAFAAFDVRSPLTPLQSALPKNTLITRSESALPKTQDLNLFRIRTSNIRRGEEQIVNQRQPWAGLESARV